MEETFELIFYQVESFTDATLIHQYLFSPKADVENELILYISVTNVVFIVTDYTRQETLTTHNWTNTKNSRLEYISEWAFRDYYTSLEYLEYLLYIQSQKFGIKLKEIIEISPDIIALLDWKGLLLVYKIPHTGGADLHPDCILNMVDVTDITCNERRLVVHIGSTIHLIPFKHNYYPGEQEPEIIDLGEPTIYKNTITTGLFGGGYYYVLTEENVLITNISNVPEYIDKVFRVQSDEDSIVIWCAEVIYYLIPLSGGILNLPLVEKMGRVDQNPIIISNGTDWIVNIDGKLVSYGDNIDMKEFNKCLQLIENEGGVKEIFPTRDAWAVLTHNNTVIPWGEGVGACAGKIITKTIDFYAGIENHPVCNIGSITGSLISEGFVLVFEDSEEFIDEYTQ